MNTNTDQNIIQRLKAAAAILEEHCQYDEDEGSGEDLARLTCHDAAALIKHLAATLEEIKRWTLDDEQTIHEHGEAATIDGCLFLDAETLNERFQTIREALAKLNT